MSVPITSSVNLPSAPAVERPTWFGHPRGMFLVAATELWERFSYWGLAGLLVLFLTATPASGGWGWETSAALQLYGWYAGLAFILPVGGAWLANNVLSERRCITLGAIVILLGHLLLAVSGLGDALRWVFLVGLALILIGTGLLKPTISSIVAELYPEGGARRDEGFAFFFVAIYIGALFGAIIAGYLGERVGWHLGFGSAGLGMAVGLACYLWKQHAWLGTTGTVIRRRVRFEKQPLTRVERDRLIVVGVQGLFTVIYAAAFYQMFGLLNVYARDHLDRHIGAFEIPTTWLQTINLWSFFVCVPALAWLWRRLARRARNPSASYKLALGIAVLGAGYGILIVAEGGRHAVNPGVIWLVAAYLLFGLGDSLVWANQISLTSKLAPERYGPVAVGGWYICIGLGTWLTGYIGALVAQYPFRNVFTGLAISCLVAAVLLTLLTPILKRYMHGAEDAEAPQQ